MPTLDHTGRLRAGLGPWLLQRCGRRWASWSRDRPGAGQGPSAAPAVRSPAGQAVTGPPRALQGPRPRWDIARSPRRLATAPAGPQAGLCGRSVCAPGKRLAEALDWAIAFARVLMATELPACSIASDEVSFPQLGCDSSRRLSASLKTNDVSVQPHELLLGFFWRWRKPLCENRVGELCVWKRPKRQFQYRNATERVC